jgi:hypothetical protein
MVRFCNDVDLLKWEPVLFVDMARSAQTLCAGGDGVTSGTTFTSAGGSFVSGGVSAGQVIYLRDSGDTIDSCYEIVSVDSATQLTLSVLRQDEDDAAVAPPAGSSLSYRISTFDPQSEEASYGLLQYFGIKASGEEGINADDIINTRAIRQACVFAVLSALFAGSACGDGDVSGFWQKSLYYQRKFHTARARTRVDIDTDDDDLAEEFRWGGSIRLRRY